MPPPHRVRRFRIIWAWVLLSGCSWAAFAAGAGETPPPPPPVDASDFTLRVDPPPPHWLTMASDADTAVFLIPPHPDSFAPPLPSASPARPPPVQPLVVPSSDPAVYPKLDDLATLPAVSYPPIIFTEITPGDTSNPPPGPLPEITNDSALSLAAAQALDEMADPPSRETPDHSSSEADTERVLSVNGGGALREPEADAERILSVIGGWALREGDVARMSFADYGQRIQAEMAALMLLSRALELRGHRIPQEDQMQAMRRDIWLLAGSHPPDDPAVFLREATGLTTRQYYHRVIQPELSLRYLMETEYRPAEGELQNWLAAHSSRYARPARVRLAHMLIRPARAESSVAAISSGPAEWEEAHRRASQARRQLDAGESFADVARRHAADFPLDGVLSDGLDGTQLFAANDLDPVLAQAAFSLPVGGGSPPIRTEWGYHILQVVESLPAASPSLADPETRSRVIADYREEMFADRAWSILEALRQMADGENWFIEARAPEPLEPGDA